MRHLPAALVLSFVFAPFARTADLVHIEDAPLYAIQFINESTGWAVGAEGAIWHSGDGGKSWKLQQSGVTACLKSVHFLNDRVGWVAGREEMPIRNTSQGLVLFTQDGGVTWEIRSGSSYPAANTGPAVPGHEESRPYEVLLTPKLQSSPSPSKPAPQPLRTLGLEDIHFFDERIGIAVGDSNEIYPTGVYRTADGGKNWLPVTGPRRTGWLRADFKDPNRGVLAGASGGLGVLRGNNVGTAEIDGMGARTLHAVKLVGDRAVAVGDGGAILVSEAGGVRYRQVELNLPSEVRSCIDLHTIAGSGTELWAAGRPGSVILHSFDLGETWELQHTGQPLPIQHLCFLDAQQGWAVGEAGTIMRTGDGGRTWQVMRRGGSRAALAAIHARAASIPVDTITQVGACEGYLVSTLQVTCPYEGTTPGNSGSHALRLANALRRAGGVSGEACWQFPLPALLAELDKAELIEQWNPLHSDRATEELLRQLVLFLRIWHPDVVIADAMGDSPGTKPVDDLVAAMVEIAMGRAGDRRSFPEQIEKLGLEPWQVSKLYRHGRADNSAQVLLDNTRTGHHLQMTIREFSREPAELLHQDPTTLPATRSYRLVLGNLKGAELHRQLLEGLNPAALANARRRLQPEPLPDALAIKMQRARRNLTTLMEAAPSPLSDPARTLAQIGPLLAGMPERDAAPAAFAAAAQYARAGQWPLAREAFVLIAQRYPKHPLAAEACRWLVRHDASSEARRRYELRQFTVLTRSAIIRKDEASPDGRYSMGGMPQLEQTQQAANFIWNNDARRWFQDSLESGRVLLEKTPMLADDPQVNFCLNAARRQIGDLEPPKQWCSRFVQMHPDGPWSTAAATELWFQHRSGNPPKPLALCRKLAEPPFLDGDLGDQPWQAAIPVVLKNAVGDTTREYKTEVRLAHDAECLYVAVACKRPASKSVPLATTRTPDADLSKNDRIGIMLDLDRDYGSYFHLQVDERGLVADECVVGYPDKSWNPRWFVASKSDAEGWRVEVAIPLTELTSAPIGLGQSWAFNVVRILPGRGVQAFSTPADVEPRPEGMGILTFVDDPGRLEKATLPATPLKKVP